MIKALVTIIILVYLFLRQTTMPDFPCNITSVFQSVPPIIWYEQTADDKLQRTFITRFFHNKANVFSSQFAKCYAGSFDPAYIYRSVGILGLFLWLYFIYLITYRKIQIFILVVLLLPFVQVLTGNQLLASVSYKILAIMGLAFLFKRL